MPAGRLVPLRSRARARRCGLSPGPLPRRAVSCAPRVVQPAAWKRHETARPGCRSSSAEGRRGRRRSDSARAARARRARCATGRRRGRRTSPRHRTSRTRCRTTCRGRASERVRRARRPSAPAGVRSPAERSGRQVAASARRRASRRRGAPIGRRSRCRRVPWRTPTTRSASSERSRRLRQRGARPRRQRHGSRAGAGPACERTCAEARPLQPGSASHVRDQGRLTPTPRLRPHRPPLLVASMPVPLPDTRYPLLGVAVKHQNSICAPSSTTRFDGSPKNLAALCALRDMTMNRRFRQPAMCELPVGSSISRPR